MNTMYHVSLPLPLLAISLSILHSDPFQYKECVALQGTGLFGSIETHLNVGDNSFNTSPILVEELILEPACAFCRRFVQLQLDPLSVGGDKYGILTIVVVVFLECLGEGDQVKFKIWCNICQGSRLNKLSLVIVCGTRGRASLAYYPNVYGND